MCVCIRCWLATVVAALLVVPQLEAAPVENPSPNSSQPPKYQASETEKISAKPSATNTAAVNPIKGEGDHEPVPDATSNVKTNIPRISVAVSSTGPDVQVPAIHKTLGEGEGSPPQGVLYQNESKNIVVSDKSIEKNEESASDHEGIPRISLSPKQTPESNDEVSTNDKTAVSSEKELKDAVPEITITEIIKPVSPSSPATPPVQNALPGQPVSKIEVTDPESDLPNKEMKVEGTAAMHQSPPSPLPPPIAEGSQKEDSAAASEKSEVPLKQPLTSTDHVQTDGEIKETVPQINVAVTEMIKPVAASSPATPPVQDALSVQPAPHSEPQAKNPSEADYVPQINVAVAEMIKPVAASSPETTPVQDAFSGDPAPKAEPQSGNPKEAEAVKPLTDKETKNEGAAASSVGSEVNVQQSPSSSLHTEGNKERSTSEPNGDQPFTTVITPVHGVPLEEKYPLANGDQNIKLTTASGNTNNVIEEDISSKSEPSTNKKPNAYTITPNEFAKKTAVAHAQKTEEESKQSTLLLSEGHMSPVEVKTEQGDTVNVNNEQKDSHKQHEESIEHEIESSNDKASGEIINKPEDKEEPKKIMPDIEVKEQALKYKNERGDLNSMSFLDLANKITNDLKAYSNEVNMHWEEKKDKISWLGEASEVLQNYNEKITETEKYSHKCTSDERKKYQERTTALKDIIKQCEATLKREDWHELQVKTSMKLSEINAIVEGANAKISEILKEDQHLKEKYLVIENDAKRKLQALNTESIKKTFSDLKNKALRIDEEDYKECIDSKEMKAKETAITSQTRTDIMKIYECIKMI